MKNPEILSMIKVLGVAAHYICNQLFPPNGPWQMQVLMKMQFIFRLIDGLARFIGSSVGVQPMPDDAALPVDFLATLVGTEARARDVYEYIVNKTGEDILANALRKGMMLEQGPNPYQNDIRAFTPFGFRAQYYGTWQSTPIAETENKARQVVMPESPDHVIDFKGEQQDLMQGVNKALDERYQELIDKGVLKLGNDEKEDADQ